MLEQQTLLLRPWNPTAAGDGGERLRAVVDAAGTPIGLVRQLPVRSPRWLRWLSRRVLEVYESPDNSLVFAVRRGWGWPGAWHLMDADERHVGTLRGQTMLDGFGHLLAVIETPDAKGRGRFLAIQGRELGEFAVQADGTRVTFAPAVEGNPFARMLLLAAALVRDL
jgi:hypothetical protein